MAKSKFEREKAREKRKKAARKREEVRRASERTTLNAIRSVLDGCATASDIARVLNTDSRPPPAHPADDELASQLVELRKTVDCYVAVFEESMELGSREWAMIPGIVVGGFFNELAEPQGAFDEFESEPCPLALGCKGRLTFEPVETYLEHQPDASAATWFITTDLDEGLDGLLCIALSGNRNGARCVHVIRNGRWARLNDVGAVERYFVRALHDIIVYEHPEGALLAAAAKMDSAARGHTSIDAALGEIDGRSDAELFARINPFIEHLRLGLRGYHDDLMSLVDHVTAIQGGSIAARDEMRKIAHENKSLASEQSRRADAAERELVRVRALLERQKKDLPATKRIEPGSPSAPALPLRDRIAEIFK